MLKTTVLALFMLSLFIVCSAVATSPAKSFQVQKLLGNYGLDWNKGPNQYECIKVAEGTELYAQIKRSTCEAKEGAQALAKFQGNYFECFNGESKHFDWMIYPNLKICKDQIETLNLPSP
jgi:hypothetical protein